MSLARRRSPRVATSRKANMRRRFQWLPLWLMLPSVVIVLVIVGYPLVDLFETSFQRYGLFQLFDHKPTWDGLANYDQILTNSAFWVAVERTVLFTLACVGGTMVIGMLVALMLTRLGRAMRGAVSIVMVLAWAMPPVSAVIVWQWLFANQFGVVDWILTALHLGNFSNLDWFGVSSFRAWFVITLMVIWQAVPFVALSLYAGLSQVPRELYEAARVDGAGALVVFKSITMRMLRPIISLLVILSVIWDFNLFTQIWVMTSGGPNGGTTTIGIWSYEEAFVSSNFGLGAAASVIAMVLVGIMSFYYIRHLIGTGEVA